MYPWGCSTKKSFLEIEVNLEKGKTLEIKQGFVLLNI